MKRPRFRPSASRWLKIARETFRAYSTDGIPRLGAALAFYTAVAMVPLLMLSVTLGGLVMGHDHARHRVLLEIEQLTGLHPGQALETIRPIHYPPSTFAWVSLVIFLIGGFGVFNNLRSSLNFIWRAPAPPEQSWLRRLRRQVFSLGAVMSTGFIVLVSLTVSAGLTGTLVHASRWGRWPVPATETASFLFSFVVVTLLIAVVFKILPNLSLPWRNIWMGAAATALLFNLGKLLLAFYFVHKQMMWFYGSAGTAIALLLWCYYVAQIVFLGAEFTRMGATYRGFHGSDK